MAEVVEAIQTFELRTAKVDSGKLKYMILL
jgi:hypothetical protein